MNGAKRCSGRSGVRSGRPRAEGESSIPTMISSAVTSSSSLPGRLSVSSPFEVLHRAVGCQAGETLYLSARPTPLAHAQKGVHRWPHSLRSVGPDVAHSRLPAVQVRRSTTDSLMLRLPTLLRAPGHLPHPGRGAVNRSCMWPRFRSGIWPLCSPVAPSQKASFSGYLAQDWAPYPANQATSICDCFGGWTNQAFVSGILVATAAACGLALVQEAPDRWPARFGTTCLALS
jgi:hypothetical protein